MSSIFNNEIIRFLVAGAATLFIDYGVLVVLTEYGNVYYILSATISYILAVLANYYICLTWVFKNSKRQSRRQFAFFLLTSTMGLLLNIIIMKIAVEILRIHYALGKLIATIVVTVWNYVTKKKSLEIV